MAPSAVTPPPLTVTELIKSGMSHTIEKTAPSLITSGSLSNLEELNAAKLVYTRNMNPKPVPVPDSPEVLAQNV